MPLYDNIYRTKEDGWSIEITPMERKGVVIEQIPAIFRLKKYYKANMALMLDMLWKVKGVAEPALMAGLEVVYKLWLRHYTSSIHETVLYASV
ncbi:MAG: hypothetical protein J6M27_07395 [Lachnospiraceae bacterium]|nr:hypothetical protein [Lachnospiraceae bacterium]